MMLSSTSMLPCAEDLGTVPDCSFRVLKEFGIPGMEIQRWMRDWGNSRDFKSSGQYRLNSIATLSTHDMAPFGAWWEFEAGTVDEKIFEQKCRAHGIAYETVAAQLFDLKRSVSGRVPWKKEVKDVESLLGILGKTQDQARDLTDWYLSTVDEKDKFLKAVCLPGKSEEYSLQVIVNKALEACGNSNSVYCIQPLQDWLSLGNIFGKPALNQRINEPGIVSDKNWRLRVPLLLEELKKQPFNKNILALNRSAHRI